MALQANSDRLIIVEIGKTRPASDLAGKNAVRIDGKSNATLLALVGRLETAGCTVVRDSPNWLDLTRFASLRALSRKPTGVL
jgi:hypothetical protein